MTPARALITDSHKSISDALITPEKQSLEDLFNEALSYGAIRPAVIAAIENAKSIKGQFK